MSTWEHKLFARSEQGPRRWEPSESWVVWSNALAAGAVVLLVGAVCQRLSYDSAGALLLFKLGAAMEVGMVVCFVVAVLQGRTTH